MREGSQSTKRDRSSLWSNDNAWNNSWTGGDWLVTRDDRFLLASSPS